MKRRTTELLLLLAASPVIILLFVLAIMNDGRPLNFETLAVPIGLFVAFILSHIAVRFFARNADPVILPVTFMLAGIGIAFVMRLAPELATRQVIWLFAAIAAMAVTLMLVPSIRKLANYKYSLMLLGIILLVLPMFIGTEVNGSKLWLSFGGFSFQPGELAKVLIVIFLAGYLADNREMLSVGGRKVAGINIPDLRTLMPLLVMWLTSLLIVVFERDLGSALLFLGLFLIMIYVATGRKSYVIVGLVLFAIGAVAAFFIFSHVQQRVDIWLDPFSYPETAYQLIQALYSLADGGLFGSGIGRGLPTLIPVVESDFIFDAIAEEMGLLGASGILMLYVILAVRGFTIAAKARSDVDAFAAVGLTAAIAFQAFVIVGGATKLIPLTGVTLPFMSQGGSSLLASFIIIGLLLRAGDSGTGIENELVGVSSFEGGVLGRVTLGKRLTLLITGFTLLFAILIGNLTWHMIINAEYMQKLPTNNHTLERTINAQRGAIITADDVTLAESLLLPQEGINWQRQYPQGTLASHLVGYYSPIFGASGVEGTYAETLAGQDGHYSSWSDAIDALAGKPVPGNDVHLTLDSRIQRAAESALEGNVGAAVVLDAQTGAVLAMASAPTYDSNSIQDLMEQNAEAVAGGGEEDSSLFNRATSGLYAPGSTFKTVTLAAALQNGSTTLSTSYSSPASITIGTNIQGGPGEITNFGNYAYGTVSLQNGFAVSSNTVFAQVARDLGAAKLVETGTAFGFNRQLDSDFYLSQSLLPDPAEMTEWETAWAGVGQPVGYHKSPSGPQATVMQMAMVAAGIANDGQVMTPYLMDHIISSEGVRLEANTPSLYSQAVSAATASQVQEAMLSVVQSGTGTATAIGGHTVRGKTGTAETGAERDNSWFIGYVETGERKVAVAIVLEQVEAGAATPKARGIFQAAVDAYAGA